jgi:hypothetical protein
MRRMVSLSMLALVILLVASNVWAWYIHCTNGSYVTEKGKLRVYYDEEASFGNCLVTGVDGLPFSLSDLARSEKNLTCQCQKIFRKKDRSGRCIYFRAGARHSRCRGDKQQGNCNQQTKIYGDREVANTTEQSGVD